MKTKIRDVRIDILKAIGIILVVAGHSNNPFSSYIYTFHMPLFFFISGYLMYKSKTRKFKDFIINKIKTIIIPYLVYWVISMIIFLNIFYLFYFHKLAPAININNIKGLILGGGYLADNSNNFPLWYLQHYFIAVIIFEIIRRYIKDKYKIIILIIISLLIIPIQTYLPGRPIFHINVLPAALTFMLIGYEFKRLLTSKEKVFTKTNNFLGITLLFLGYVISTKNYGDVSKIKSYYYIIGATLTIISLYILSGNIKENKLLEYIGANTLPILCLHSLVIPVIGKIPNEILLNLGIKNLMLENIILVTISIVVSITLYEIYLNIKNKLIIKRP